MSTSDANRLSRLRLENFRGFESLDLRFEDDLTVLVGPNGAGKSAIVDAIALLPVVREKLSLQARDVRVGATRARILCEVVGHGHELTTEVDASRDADGDIDSSLVRGGRAVTPVVYRVNRVVHDETPGTTEGRTWTRSDAYAGWQDAARFYGEFFLWFKETEDLENEQMRYDGAGPNPQLTAVRRAIQALLPEIEEIRVRRDLPPLVRRPVLALRKHGVWLPFDALSEGERTTVAMVGDIARRLVLMGEGEGEDPLAASAVVIIDEIEQHAHPGWQRQILRRLRRTFPNVQFIVTTHSPIIVSEVEPRNLRVLKDSALVEPEHGLGRDANTVLEDVFDVAPRPQEVHDKLQQLADAIDDDRLDVAETLVAECERLLPGGDPDLVYYRNLLLRLRDP
ncbi:AAA family ATPase [Haliangium sp.]|uniref:AAA family ATPase n=1 Tax=Haliangium sp. TaxID=2663208 RepID=UPI003D0B14AA